MTPSRAKVKPLKVNAYRSLGPGRAHGLFQRRCLDGLYLHSRISSEKLQKRKVAAPTAEYLVALTGILPLRQGRNLQAR